MLFQELCLAKSYAFSGIMLLRGCAFPGAMPRQPSCFSMSYAFSGVSLCQKLCLRRSSASSSICTWAWVCVIHSSTELRAHLVVWYCHRFLISGAFFVHTVVALRNSASCFLGNVMESSSLASFSLLQSLFSDVWRGFKHFFGASLRMGGLKTFLGVENGVPKSF